MAIALLDDDEFEYQRNQIVHSTCICLFLSVDKIISKDFRRILSSSSFRMHLRYSLFIEDKVIDRLIDR